MRSLRLLALSISIATTYAFTSIDTTSTARTIHNPHDAKRQFLMEALQVASSSSSSLRALGREGLSKYHQSILSRMATDRQRFVSGKYPVICEVTEPPTLKWLQVGRGGGKSSTMATSQLLINGTTVERSLASYDRFQWLDDEERDELHEKYALLSWELLAVINIPKPGYVSVLPGYGAGSTSASLRFLESTSRWDRWKLNGMVLDELEDRVCRDRLWVTGFSLAGREGILTSVDTDSGHIQSVNSRTAKSLLWPNEVSPVPAQFFTPPPVVQRRKTLPINNLKDAVLVSDGFLVPGKDRGGIYVVNQPGNPNTEWTVCLTDQRNDNRWFYHRAIWLDLTGDGRQSILTARARFPLGGGGGSGSPTGGYQNGTPSKPRCGQLVCLEMPKPYRVDEETGTPLERDGTVFDPLSARHLPWKVHVLDEGPDVMFSVVDMDPTDDTIEVIASQFFGEKVSLHSIKRGETPKVAFKRTIDRNCGKAFGCTVADLEEQTSNESANRYVVDSGSTVETLREGDAFSHLLVTSHECSYREERNQLSANAWDRLKHNNNGATERVDLATTTTHSNHQSSVKSPTDGGSLFAYRVPPGKGKWKTDPWLRTTVATGFKVQGQLNNMINPGAPGFVYTFHARKEDKYGTEKRRPLIAVAGDCAESAYIFRPTDCSLDEDEDCYIDTIPDPAAEYDLMVELKCSSTVGSIGVGYGDFCEMEQGSGYAKLYIPCYEDDKVLVFGLGSGED